MTAITKVLAMANPTHVATCVATVAGVISSKFAIDVVTLNTTQDKLDDLGRKLVKGAENEILTDEEIDQHIDR